ncbi:FAD-dependent monooxygenase [uncultured Enterovirga sp.]|uniref:FAD-dependent monooxygenase n=1 Tax=uncultured Enterovirga sp. TaxID=2026352 RepID=UPI0035CA942F
MPNSTAPSRPARSRPPAWRILIAGGGIPSLTLGLALRQGAGEAAEVTIVDPGRTGRAPDMRAYAISPAAMRMFGALGVGEALRLRAQPITAMSITDSRAADVVRPEYLAFEAEDRDAPLGFMLESAVLTDALGSAARNAGVRFETGTVTSLEAAPGEIRVGGPHGESRPVALLVAADGARSRLREAAGIGWTGRRYRQSALVATIAHERPHGGRAVQHFLPGGPFAILPLAGGGTNLPHRSSIVWTEMEDEARALAAAPAGLALPAVEARFGHVLGAIVLETRLQAVPLSVGLARGFVANRIALLGDAAHEIHPLAGQGLNLGLADAASLAEHVVDAIRLGLDPAGTDVLRAYERDRRFDAVALAGVTDALNRLFSNDSLPIRALRDLGLGIVDRAPGLKGLFARGASGETRRAPRLMRGEAL